MKSFIFTILTAAFVASVFWAYTVNYQTRAAEGELRDLKAAIKGEKSSIKVLETEWAYLNRPERLSALSETYFDVLGLAPMRSDHYAEPGLVAYPLPPEIIVTDPVEAAARDDADKEATE